jgi:hypothetical protein
LEDNIKMDVGDIEWGGINWIGLLKIGIGGYIL